MANKNSFVMYNDYENYFAQLDMAERGRLITAIFSFNINGEEPEDLTPAAYMAFSFMRDQFRRDLAKYEQRIERCKKNGKKGGRPKNDDMLSESYD